MIFMQTSLRLLSGGTGKPVLRSLLIMINILKYLILFILCCIYLLRCLSAWVGILIRICQGTVLLRIVVQFVCQSHT